jgi:hypothetical protein
MLAALFKVWQFVRSAAVRICAYTIHAFKAKKRDQHPRARPMTPELPSTCYGAAAR